MSLIVKVFGCRPHDGGAARTGPASENLHKTGPSESVATLDRGPRLEDHVTLSELGRFDEAF